MSDFEWYGEQVVNRILNAAEGAMRDTMEAGSKKAAGEIPESGFRYRSIQWGTARQTVLRHPRPLRREGLVITGYWGSNLWRFLFIEKGTIHMTGQHFLTRAADAEYPNLLPRMRRYL